MVAWPPLEADLRRSFQRKGLPDPVVDDLVQRPVQGLGVVEGRRPSGGDLDPQGVGEPLRALDFGAQQVLGGRDEVHARRANRGTQFVRGSKGISDA